MLLQREQGFGPEARVHCGQITWEHSLRLVTTTHQVQSVPFQAYLGESLFMAAPTAAQVQQVPKADCVPSLFCVPHVKGCSLAGVGRQRELK